MGWTRAGITYKAFGHGSSGVENLATETLKYSISRGGALQEAPTQERMRTEGNKQNLSGAKEAKT